MKPMSCSTTTTERVLAISLQQDRRLHGFGIGHTGNRLVDQQQLRLLCEQHANLQPLLLPVRQIGCQLVASDASAARS